MKTESPRFLARLAGVFFLFTILGGIIAQGLISNRLINFGDAVATANNILRAAPIDRDHAFESGQLRRADGTRVLRVFGFAWRLLGLLLNLPAALAWCDRDGL